MKPPTDPVEAVIWAALIKNKIAFTMDGDPEHPEHHLDFHLTAMDVAIECKRFHSDRINKQLTRHNDIIVIQGLTAAKTFTFMISQGMVQA